MAVKLADTLAPMGDFPAARSSDVSIEVGGTQKSIQKAYDDGDLGGGGASIQYTELPEGTEALVGKVYQYVGDTTMVYRNGFFYKCGPSYIPPEGYTCYGVSVPSIGSRIFLYLRGEPETPTSEDLFSDPQMYMGPISDSSRFVSAADLLGEITDLVIDGDSISFTCRGDACQGSVYDPINHLDDYWCWTYDLSPHGLSSIYYYVYALKSQPVSAENLYVDTTNIMSLSQSAANFALFSLMTTISNVRVEDGVLMFTSSDMGDCVCFPYENYSWSQVVSSPLDCEFDQEPARGSGNLMKSGAIYESVAKVNDFIDERNWSESFSGGVTHAVAFNNLGLVGDLSGNYTMLYTHNMRSGSSMGNAGAVVASCVHKGQLYFSDGTPGGLYKLVNHSAAKISAADGYSIVALESFKDVIVFAVANPASSSQTIYKLTDEETVDALPNYGGPTVTCLRKTTANELYIGSLQGLYYTRDLATFNYSEPSALKSLRIVEISPAFETPYDSYNPSSCFIKAVDSEGVPSLWKHSATLVPSQLNVPDKLKGVGCFVRLPDGRIAAANKSVWTFKIDTNGSMPSSMDGYELVYDGEADANEVSFMVVAHDETGSKSLSVFKTGKGYLRLNIENSEFVKKLALDENLLKVTLDYVGENEWSVDKSPNDLNYAFTQKIPIHLTLKNQGVEIPIISVKTNGSVYDYIAVASGIIRKDGANKVVSAILSGYVEYWESVEIVESECKQVYSTTETDTGDVWIDGKHLYRKIYQVVTSAEVTQTRVNITENIGMTAEDIAAVDYCMTIRKLGSNSQNLNCTFGTGGVNANAFVDSVNLSAGMCFEMVYTKVSS